MKREPLLLLSQSQSDWLKVCFSPGGSIWHPCVIRGEQRSCISQIRLTGSNPSFLYLNRYMCHNLHLLVQQTKTIINVAGKRFKPVQQVGHKISKTCWYEQKLGSACPSAAMNKPSILPPKWEELDDGSTGRCWWQPFAIHPTLAWWSTAVLSISTVPLKVNYSFAPRSNHFIMCWMMFHQQVGAGQVLLCGLSIYGIDDVRHYWQCFWLKW